MARNIIITIVCLSFFAARAQSQFGPVASDEEVIRTNFAAHFLSPVELRSWEINEDTVDAWRHWELAESFYFGINRGTIPMIADLQSLHPYFRDKVLDLIRECKAKGIELAVVETYRTRTKQNEYRSKGHRYTRLSGGYSRHQYGLAVDVVPMVNSVPQWRNIALWRKIGAVGEHLGLRWGGRWRKPFDPGHFEWVGKPGEFNLMSLTQGAFPVVPKHKADEYPCIEEDIRQLQRHWKAWEIEQSAVAKKEKNPYTAGKTHIKQPTQGGNQ